MPIDRNQIGKNQSIRWLWMPLTVIDILHSCRTPTPARDGRCAWTVVSSIRNARRIRGSARSSALATWRRTFTANSTRAEILPTASDWPHLPTSASSSSSATTTRSCRRAHAKKVSHLTPLRSAASVASKFLASPALLWDPTHRESRRRFHNHLAECKIQHSNVK